MINVETASNAELDMMGQESDARQGVMMMQAVYAFLGRFIAYPNEHAHVAHALWCVHAHLMDKWETTPRIAFTSPEAGSGKTRCLEATALLVPRPVFAVNVSCSYLFRKVGSGDGVTLLHDEIDAVFGPKARENEELRALLNAGHSRSAVVGRCVVRGKTVETEEIPAYAAVALAGLGWLPDTILTRSVVIRMRRRHAGERVEPYRPRLHAAEGEAIRARIELWARAAEINWPALPAQIEDRDADNWEPLISVADAVGGEWPSRARVAAVALLTATREDAEPSLGIRLLADIRTVLITDEMPTKALLAALISLEESPWGDLKGKPLDERGLARRLRQYSIRSCNLVVGTARPKGYRRADFVDVWPRYLPPSPDRSATAARTATNGQTGVPNGNTARPRVALVAPVADLPEGREPDPDGWSFHLDDLDDEKRSTPNPRAAATAKGELK